MLELSWDGFREHTEQGWNIGRPPYGYRADKLPHPVPARRAEGRTKTRLIPDPITGPAVTRIFRLRVIQGLGYKAIADQLNLDLTPQPATPTGRSKPPGRSLDRISGAWRTDQPEVHRLHGVESTRHQERRTQYDRLGLVQVANP
jgi:site-specific DNA recombinase